MDRLAFMSKIKYYDIQYAAESADASMRNYSEQNQLYVEEQFFNLHFLEIERHF